MANDFKNTKAFIRKYGKEVESEIKTRLLNYGKKATGKLYKSIRADVKENKSEFILTVSMEDYGEYVDKGVSGAGIPKGFKGKKKQLVTSGKYKFGFSMPPDNKEFRKWVSIKGIPKKASFPIRRSIWIFGIAPTNFFTIPIKRREKQFDKGVEKAMALDIENMIKKDLKK
jgi:hypothetical protein